MRNKLAICAILILLPVILYAQTIRNTRLAQLNQVIYADVMIGADAGAKITNCFAELPSTGGTCDARGLEGVQSATTTIAVPDDVTLLMGATTLTSSADPGFTLGNSSAIIGLGQGKTTLRCSSTTGTCIKSVDNTVSKLYPELRSFSLLATGTHTTSRGVDWTSFNVGRIQDVQIFDFGTQLFLDASSGVTGSTLYNVFDHNRFGASNASSGFDGVEIRRQANANRFYSCRFSRLDLQIIIGNASESDIPNELLFVGTTMELSDTASLEILRTGSVYFLHGRFESNAIAIRAAADSLVRNIVIESPHFSGNTTDVSDSSPGLSIRPFGAGAKFEGRQSGLMNEAAPNLIANALIEGWNGTTDLLGWTSLTTTNWDTTGNETQESTIIQSGSFSVKAGDGTNTSRGIATPNISDIDPTKTYTLKFNWTTPNVTNGKMRYGFRLLDSSDVLITTGNVEGYALTATGTGTSVLTHSGSFNAHVIGSDQAPIAANTMQIQGHVLKFPTGVASVRFGIWASGGAAPDRSVYVDDVYFAEGIASLRGEDKKIGDSGDQTLHGTFKPDAITTGVLNNIRVVDGNKYALTAAGLQQAIDDAEADTVVREVLLPNDINIGTTTITVNADDLELVFARGATLTYTGNGVALDIGDDSQVFFNNRIINPILDLTGAGASAIGIRTTRLRNYSIEWPDIDGGTGATQHAAAIQIRGGVASNNFSEQHRIVMPRIRGNFAKGIQTMSDSTGHANIGHIIGGGVILRPALGAGTICFSQESGNSWYLTGSFYMDGCDIGVSVTTSTGGIATVLSMVRFEVNNTDIVLNSATSDFVTIGTQSSDAITVTAIRNLITLDTVPGSNRFTHDFDGTGAGEAIGLRINARNVNADTLLKLDSSDSSMGAGSDYILARNGATTRFRVGGDGQVSIVSFVFASLPTPADGTFVYCSDCTKATPCAGSGSGAFAKRINGAWDCD